MVVVILVTIGVLVVILFNLSAFYYVLSFVVLVISGCCFLVCGGHVRGLIPLLLVLVYVGAMMVMFGYVCAVLPPSVRLITPNMLFINTVYVLLLCMCVTLSYFSTSAVSHGGSVELLGFYLYTGQGAVVFLFLIVLLLVLLVLVSNRISVKTTLRGV